MNKQKMLHYLEEKAQKYYDLSDRIWHPGRVILPTERRNGWLIFWDGPFWGDDRK